MKIRIKFQKHGAMKFIGHLDILRYFQKAIRRSGIDVAYSGGYSPHQIMTFAAPLGVGMESNGEYMDIECHSITSSEDMKSLLNAQMVEGMKILSVKQLPEKAGNAMSSVAAASYTVYFKDESIIPVNLPERITEMLNMDSLIITKKTKKSSADLDLKPSIYKLSATEDGKGVYMMVDASSSGNIKPRYVIEAILQCKEGDISDYDLQMTREETYTNTGSEDEKQFVSLDDVGDNF